MAVDKVVYDSVPESERNLSEIKTFTYTIEMRKKLLIITSVSSTVI